MAAIEFVSGPAWQRLGWTLLHFVWQGAAVAALTSLAVGLLRLGHGRGRHAVYLVALAGMAACPAVTFFVVGAPAAAVEEIVAEPPSRPVVYVAAVLRPGATEADLKESGITAPAPVTHDPPAGPGWREFIVGRLHTALPWIVGGWLVGVFVLSARLTLGIAGSWRWRRDLMPLPELLGERVAVLVSRLGLARRACVFVSSRAVQAMTVGWLRQIVLVPASFLSKMPPEVLEGVVAHELAHILRRDLWVNLFQRVVETLLFYHPAVWWLSGRLRYERELCCDALAVGATGHQVAYAQALEWAGRAAAPARAATLAAGFARGHRALLDRVRHVLGLAPVPQCTRGALAGLIAVAAVVFALVAIGASQVQAGGTQRSSVHELPPQWPEFTAKKVSFAEAGLEPLSASELVQRLRVAQEAHKRSITKSESYKQWFSDYSRPEMEQYSGEQDLHYLTEMRYDGKRYAVRMHRWGTAVGPHKKGISEFNQAYTNWLWDGGTRVYQYESLPSYPPERNIVNINEAWESPENAILVGGPEMSLRGWYSSATESVEAALAGARSIQVRNGLERIGESDCYALEADTKYGRYVLWIDPAHGYNVARAEVTMRKGDLYGQKRLPWPGNVKEKRTVENVRFEQLNGVWVPMECDIRMESKSPGGTSKSITRHKRTEVILNPDFDALGSFLPDDINEGAIAFIIPPNSHPGSSMTRCVWHNGKPVPVDRGESREGAEETGARSRLKVKVGDLAPDFTVETLEGDKFRLSDYRGKVVLLHFWAMWCKGCVADAPRLKSEYDAIIEDHREHFAMLSLSLDNLETPVRRHVKEHGLTWPHARVGLNSQIVADYGVTGVPKFFFVGPDGKIIPSDETSVMTILKSLQTREPAAPPASAPQNADTAVPE